MCKVYTSRIGYGGADGLDITVKSGQGVGRLLAPTWELVMGLKQNRISQVEYTARFLAILRERYHHDKAAFVDLLKRDCLVLLCYCPARPGVFCHRTIVVDVLRKIAEAKGLPFEYGGEIS